MNNQQIEEYRILCISELQGFLNGDFINCDPYDQSDANVILEADSRSRIWLHQGKSFLSQSARFCSLMEVDGVVTNIYHLDRFVEVLQFHPMNCKEKWRAEIPFNHFQFPMMLDNGKDEVFDESRARFACCLDEKIHDKDSILARLNGLMLYSYHLGGITKFNQKRCLYRLATFSRENLTDVIRKEMVKAQAIVIQYLLKYPEYCRPMHEPFDIPNPEACKIMREQWEALFNEIEAKSALVKERLIQYSIQPEKI